MTVSDTDRWLTLGLNAGHQTVSAAEHWIHELVAVLGRAAVEYACTHLVAEPYPHVAVTLRVRPGEQRWMPAAVAAATLGCRADPDHASRHHLDREAATLDPAIVVRSPGTPPVSADPATRHLLPGARRAADTATTRTEGRAVVFPGVERLVGTVLVDDVLRETAIGQVSVLGGGDADPATLLDTRDFVRPIWRSGTLTLVTQPARGGRLVPFETEHPTPCCAEH